MNMIFVTRIVRIIYDQYIYIIIFYDSNKKELLGSNMTINSFVTYAVNKFWI